MDSLRLAKKDFKDMLPAAGTKLLLPDQAQPLSNADVKIILDGEREKAARDGPFTPWVSIFGGVQTIEEVVAKWVGLETKTGWRKAV